jgi:hypothetical protein
MTKRRIRRLLVCGAAALVTAAGACTSSPPRTALLPSGAPTPVAVGIAGLHLPIETYLLTPAQSVQRDWVASVIVSRCMARYGFSYPAGLNASGDQAALNAYTVMFRRYGITEAQIVRVWGYHVPRDQGGVWSPAAAKPVLPDGELSVLSGTDPHSGAAATAYAGQHVAAGGCAGEPGRVIPHGDELQGPATDVGQIVATIKSGGFTDSLADPRVTSVIAAWSACMRGHGYNLTSPLTATVALPSMQDAEPSTAEIAQAEADVACKARTNLVGVWFAVESDYENSAIRANLSALEPLIAQRDAEAAAISHLFTTYHNSQ